jgi:hypothetical protein
MQQKKYNWSIIVWSSKKYGSILFVIFILLFFTTMDSSAQQKNTVEIIQPQLFTVANIVLVKKAGYYEITFYQSARFYKLLRTNKNCAKALLLLKQSKKQKQTLQVLLTQNLGDIIDNVKKAQ